MSIPIKTLKNNKKKTDLNTTTTKLYSICDTIENNKDRTDYIINHFSNGIGSPLDYKWIILFVPLIIYLIIMFGYIYNITEVNITDQSKSFTSELIGGFISFFVIFIARFIIDLIYQFNLCVGQNNITSIKLIKNSLYNSLGISIAVSLGYFMALNIDNPKIDSQINIYQKSFIRNISNHKYNMILSIIFYFIFILYTNPITFDKKVISRNKVC